MAEWKAAKTAKMVKGRCPHKKPIMGKIIAKPTTVTKHTKKRTQAPGCGREEKESDEDQIGIEASISGTDSDGVDNDSD